MTVADASFVGSDRPVVGQAVLWLAAGAVAIMAHGGVVLVALRQPPPTPAEDSAPPAITIDLAPAPVAPQATEGRIAPDTIDAPAVDASAPNRMPVPAPPPPTAVATIAPQEAAERAPPPDPLAPPNDRHSAAVPAEGDVAAAGTGGAATLVRAGYPSCRRGARPGESAPPPPPSTAAARAQVRTEQAEAAAPPRSSAGTRGMSPAKWQAKLMAHLER